MFCVLIQVGPAQVCTSVNMDQAFKNKHDPKLQDLCGSRSLGTGIMKVVWQSAKRSRCFRCGTGKIALGKGHSVW